MTLTGCGIVSTGDTYESRYTYPCLNSGVFVRQEAQIEVPGAFPVQGEAIRALRWVCGDVVLQEDIYG